jgi:hypothetical protein
LNKTFRVSKKVKIILSILLPVLSCCLLSYQLFYFKCLWNCAPKRTFTTEEFVLPKEYFPDDAVFSKLVGTREDIQSIYSVYSIVYWGDRSALYEIRRLPTKRVAINEYDRKAMYYTNSLDLLGQYSRIIDFSSSIADKYQVTCARGLYKRTSCAFIARYDEFVIFFNATIGSKDLKEENYLEVLKHIDKTMANLLMK